MPSDSQTAILQSVQANYPAIDKAAGVFLQKLTGTDISRDITLAAEMSGLALLRQGTADVSKMPPGMAVLGAVPDDALETLQKFVVGWAASNRIDFRMANPAGLPKDKTAYLPELTKFELPFRTICLEQGIAPGLIPFVAATSALKLVLAGNQLKLIDISTALAIVMFHVVAGAKMVPHPL